MDDNQLLTYTEAGKIAGVSHSTISKWVDGGWLKCSPMPGSTRQRIRRGTLIAFLRSLETSESSATSASLPADG